MLFVIGAVAVPASLAIDPVTALIVGRERQKAKA